MGVEFPERALVAAVLLQAIADGDVAFLASTTAEGWAEEVGVHPDVWRGLPDRLARGFAPGMRPALRHFEPEGVVGAALDAAALERARAIIATIPAGEPGFSPRRTRRSVRTAAERRSRYLGVYWSGMQQAWLVYFRTSDVPGAPARAWYLGTFRDEGMAARAWNLAAEHVWGDGAPLNDVGIE